MLSLTVYRLLKERINNTYAEVISSILSEALAVAFDQNVGHDYVENGEERFEFYHKKEEKVEFDLDYFNRITKGGLPQKTLNIALAGTGVGKSLFMCHMTMRLHSCKVRMFFI